MLYHTDASNEYVDAVAALRDCALRDGGNIASRAAAEALATLREQAYLAARHACRWIETEPGTVPPLPEWVSRLRDYLDHVSILYCEGGSFLLAGHVYDFTSKQMMAFQRACGQCGVQWCISAQSWYFPGYSLLVEIAEKIEPINILQWQDELSDQHGEKGGR